MKPEQVLDMQADLMRRMEDPDFREVMQNTLGAAGNREVLTDSQNDENARIIVRTIRSHVPAAYAYRVTEDMSVMVQHVARSLDDTDQVVLDLAPTECGIVRFERPLPITDARGVTMLIHWMTWGRIEVTGSHDMRTSAIFVSMWNDRSDPDDVSRRLAGQFPRIDKAMGRWAIIGGSVLYPGMVIGEPLTRLTPKAAAKILQQGDEPTPYTNVDRYVHALWLLLDQTVTLLEDEHVRKSRRQWARRVGIPDRVTVVRLRRAAGNPGHEGESLVEWSHRWVVRSHLRWQPYGGHSPDHAHVLGQIEVEAGHSVRYCVVAGCDHVVKRIVIAPYVKGPAGLPLVITDKVYSLER